MLDSGKKCISRQKSLGAKGTEAYLKDAKTLKGHSLTRPCRHKAQLNLNVKHRELKVNKTVWLFPI